MAADRKKIPFTSFVAFNGLGYSLKNVIKADLSGYSMSQSYQLNSPVMAHPWTSWVKYNQTVYYVGTAGLIGVPSMAVFTNNHGKTKWLLPVNNADIDILLANPDLPVMQNNDSRIIH